MIDELIEKGGKPYVVIYTGDLEPDWEYREVKITIESHPGYYPGRSPPCVGEVTIPPNQVMVFPGDVKHAGCDSADRIHFYFSPFKIDEGSADRTQYEGTYELSEELLKNLGIDESLLDENGVPLPAKRRTAAFTTQSERDKRRRKRNWAPPKKDPNMPEIESESD